VLIFSAGQFVGVFAWFSLPELSLTVPQSYLLAKNLAWGLISLVAGIGLITGRRWALPLGIWGTLVYTAFQLFDVLVLRSSEYAIRSRLFNVIAALGILILIEWFLTRPGVQSYFRRKPG
jgi:uncharacterized membrane protein